MSEKIHRFDRGPVRRTLFAALALTSALAPAASVHAGGALAGVARVRARGCEAAELQVTGISVDGRTWRVVLAAGEPAAFGFDGCPAAPAGAYTGEWNPTRLSRMASGHNCLTGADGVRLCLGPISEPRTLSPTSFSLCLPGTGCTTGEATLMLDHRADRPGVPF